MLVLTRKFGQSITIGDNIEILVMPNNAVQSCQVRIGIKAPKDVIIKRTELVDKEKINYNR